MENLHYDEGSMEEFLGGELGSPSRESEKLEMEEADQIYSILSRNEDIKSRARQTLESISGCNTIVEQIQALRSLGYKCVPMRGKSVYFNSISTQAHVEALSSFYDSVLNRLRGVEQDPTIDKALVNRIYKR